MEWSYGLIGEILTSAILVGLVSSFYLFYRRNRSESVDRLRKEMDDKTQDLRVEFTAEVSRLRERIELLEHRGNKSVDLFKTVLHGFDFIVQGCKKAIDSGEMGSGVLSAGENDALKIVGEALAKSEHEERERSEVKTEPEISSVKEESLV